MNYFIYNCGRYLCACDPGERAIEIPIVCDLIKDSCFDILEVGNVLNNWIRLGRAGHRVVDKYDTSPGVDSCDILEYISDIKYSWVISISTLEHIGHDAPEEFDPNKPLAAYNYMKSFLIPGGIMIITWPVGYNLALDEQFESGLLDLSYVDYMKRISQEHRWIQCEWKDIKDCKYGTPFYAGNGLIIG